jgi:ribosomal-protein-alanine N-acetyltransferase
MDSFFNKNHFFKIAVNDDKVIGYIIYSVIFDESEILNVVVDSFYRGKSFGIQLLNYAIEDIKNKKCLNVFLEVAKKNVIAKNLYLKLGFVEYNIRKNYYKNDDAVLMKKVLS